MTFGEKLRNLRKSRGLSKTELGRKVNKSRWSVYNWEHDLHMPDFLVLQRISDILEVGLDYWKS